mgnify:CR=1 FL=1
MKQWKVSSRVFRATARDVGLWSLVGSMSCAVFGIALPCAVVKALQMEDRNVQLSVLVFGIVLGAWAAYLVEYARFRRILKAERPKHYEYLAQDPLPPPLNHYGRRLIRASSKQPGDSSVMRVAKLRFHLITIMLAGEVVFGFLGTPWLLGWLLNS